MTDSVFEVGQLYTAEIQFYFDGGGKWFPDYQVTIDSLAAFFTYYQNLTVEISNHTDLRGSASYNKSLSQPFSIYTFIYYQVVPPGFLAEMFNYNSAEIDTVRNMFNVADQLPFLFGSHYLINIASESKIPDYDDLIKVGPSPTSDGYVNIYLSESSDHLKFTLYEINGRFIGNGVIRI